uniref:Uncharacterized protein n=1 Tax=Glossina morsitans morsitans TaxID=37546 RepID=A0A1B0GDN4_GLOMM
MNKLGALRHNYALVEVPRSLWNNAKPGFIVQYAYFKLSKLNTEKVEAEENVDDVLESWQGWNELYALIRIHKQVIKSLQTLQRTEALGSVQVETVLHLEGVARNMNSPDRRFKSEFPHQRSKFGRILYSPVLHWYWACLLRSPFLKALCVLTAFMSGLVVWRRPVLSIFANILNVAKHNN